MCAAASRRTVSSTSVGMSGSGIQRSSSSSSSSSAQDASQGLNKGRRGERARGTMVEWQGAAAAAAATAAAATMLERPCSPITGPCRRRLTMRNYHPSTQITRHTSHVTHHTSHLTHHTSHITLHTSHITHHTSHHTSHFTHHTSHITHSICLRTSCSIRCLIAALKAWAVAAAASEVMGKCLGRV